MNSSRPLVSIIIPCYNAAQWIAETIQSCLQQSHHPLEIIIVDDGSTDGSLAVIQSFANDVKYITDVNFGLSSSRNRGFALSQGDYVLFLDADDLIAKDHIEVLVTALENELNFIALSQWSHLENQQGKWVAGHFGETRPQDNDPVKGLLHGFLTPSQGWGVPVHCVLWPRNVIDKMGGSDELLTTGAEVDCFLEALLAGVQIIYAEGGGAYYRYHGQGSISHSSHITNRHFKSLIRIFQRLETRLEKLNRLQDYNLLLGQVYYNMARMAIINNLDDIFVEESLQHAIYLAGNQAITGTFPNRILCQTIGLRRKEKLAHFLAQSGIANRARKEYGKL